MLKSVSRSANLLIRRMPLICMLCALIIIGLGGINGASGETAARPGLERVKVESLATGYGPKAVIFSADRSKLYAINLEGLSVYEFDRATRRILRKLVFVAHAGKGYNYTKKVWFDSYQEKPVEACITHNGRYLWTSLHNAGGVVVWDLEGGDTYVQGQPYKDAWLYDRTAGGDAYAKKAVKLLWIKTGTTPKVLAPTPDGRYVFVANWHDNSVSVIATESPEPAGWRVIRTWNPGPIPRGMVASPDSSLIYIGMMGSDYIGVYDIATWKRIKVIQTGINPRHVIMGDGCLYITLNLGSKLVKYDIKEGKIARSVPTEKSPRTVALSPDGKVLFVTCYNGDYLQAFTADDLTLLGTWKCTVHPVAVDVYQDGDLIEAWVGNHSNATIRVFTFRETGSLAPAAPVIDIQMAPAAEEEPAAPADAAI